MWRERAHLRLPSMTIAICRGTVRLDLEDLFFFCRPDLVCHEDVAVSQLLQRRLRTLHLVARHAGALLLRAHLVVRVAPKRAYLDATVLDLLVEHLHKILAPLLGERGDVEPNDVAIVVRRETEVRRRDPFLVGLEQSLVPGLDQDLRRLRSADRRELDEGRAGPAVRLDLE